MPAKLEFWFEYGSTYTYLSVGRIRQIARSADVEVVWKPFLLGALFKAIGTPLEIYSAHWASNRSSQGNSEALSVHGRLANNAQGVWGLPGIALEEAGPQRSMLRSKGKDGALQPRTQIILRITKP